MNIHTFHKAISPKVKVIYRLSCAHYDIAVHYLCLHVSLTPPTTTKILSDTKFDETSPSHEMKHSYQ